VLRHLLFVSINLLIATLDNAILADNLIIHHHQIQSPPYFKELVLYSYILY